jgi:hypothetical protein
MTLGEALNELFKDDKQGGPQYDGDISANTKEQYAAIVWNDSRPQPKWETVAAKMAEPIIKPKTIEERLAALEQDVTSIKAKE